MRKSFKVVWCHSYGSNILWKLEFSLPAEVFSAKSPKLYVRVFVH